jgi:transposase-like protein
VQRREGLGRRRHDRPSSPKVSFPLRIEARGKFGNDRYGSRARITAAQGATAEGTITVGCAKPKRAGVPTEVAEKMKALERENRELKQANEILRKASAYFALAELAGV